MYRAILKHHENFFLLTSIFSIFAFLVIIVHASLSSYTFLFAPHEERFIMNFTNKWSKKKDANVQVTVVDEGISETSEASHDASRFECLKIYLIHSKFLRFASIGVISVLCIVLATVLAVTQVVVRKGHTRIPSNTTFAPIRPPSFPLAVRNPYLSTWIPSALVQNLPSSVPQFWAGQDLTWGIIVRVDGIVYNVMGVPQPIHGTKSAVVERAEFTSTHTLFTVKAGSVTFTLDFFSPVSPSNYLRQSLPFSEFIHALKIAR